MAKATALLALATSTSDALQFVRARTPRAELKASLSDVQPWTKDAFNNVRVPAALLSGSSFVAVNTASLPVAGDAFWVGLAKRLYLTVAVSSFASTLLTVLVSTVALEKLAKASVDDADLEFDYVACQSHLYFGVLGACLLVGLRAWIAFTCPAFGKVAFGIMSSSFLLMLHFVPMAIAAIPLRYAQMIAARLWFSPLLLMACVSGSYTLWLLLKGFYLGLFTVDPANPVWALCPRK